VRRRLRNGVEIFLSPDSQLKYLKPSFDDDLFDIARNYAKSDSVVWDIGANCGVFSFLAAGAKERVAVEPDPFLCHLIQESSALSGVDVTLVPAAAYSHIGLGEFVIAARGRASNHLTAAGGRSQSGGERSRLRVPMLTLDFLAESLGAPTLIKIDVEGAELHVLRGAPNVLRQRPVLYIEIGQTAEQDCLSLLKAAGYRVRSVSDMNWLAEPERT
jgi:FkbM family methyltransferase